jgi:hypothetical protein
MEIKFWKVPVATAAAVGAMLFGPVAASAVGSPLNVRGTITHVAGNTIDVMERGGSSATVHLTNNAKITSVAKASLSDVKPGSFIGTTATPQPDGTLQAIEIHIFPPAMRGTGDGSRAWDLVPRSSMTNGTVAQKVNNVAGDKLTVDYRGGDKVVTVTPKTEVVALVLGDRSELKPKTKIFIPGATKGPDGALEASRVTVGEKGLAPPM